MRLLSRVLLPALAIALPAANGHASLGPYEHGAGIKSQGAGGISYAFGEESTVISINPAIAAALDTRFDIGVPELQSFGSGCSPARRADAS